MSSLSSLLLASLTVFSMVRAQEPARPPVEHKPVVTVAPVREPAKPPADKPKPDEAKPAVEQPKEGGKPSDAEKKPTTEKPTTEKPTTEKPTTEKPTTEKPNDEEPIDQPLPPGASPDDIRAMRSAQQMISTERRLMKRVKSGEINGVDTLLRFEDISGWPYQDGLKGCPEEVRKLDGRKVAMIGFMLPIDEVEHIKEFLLVQSLWACCYGTPPDINGIVRVVMKGDTRTDYEFNPVLVTGTVRVKETREDGYCIDIYQVEADSVSVVK